MPTFDDVRGCTQELEQRTMSGITGLLESVLIFFLRSMVTANKARVGGGDGGAPVGIRKGIRD